MSTPPHNIFNTFPQTLELMDFRLPYAINSSHIICFCDLDGNISNIFFPKFEEMPNKDLYIGRNICDLFPREYNQEFHNFFMSSREKILNSRNKAEFFFEAGFPFIAVSTLLGEDTIRLDIFSVGEYRGVFHGHTNNSETHALNLPLVPRNNHSNLKESKKDINDILLSLYQKVLSGEDISITLQESIEYIGKMLKADYAYISIFDEQKKQMTISAIYGSDKKDLGKSYKYENLSPLLKSKKPPKEENFDFFNITTSFTKIIPNIKTSIRASIKVDHHRFGFISLHRATDTRFNSDDQTILNDISSIIGIALQRESYLRELYKKAFSDELTNLPNKSSLNLIITEAIKNAKKNKSKFATLMIDIDHFKDINESLGHNAGDLFIKKISERMQTFLNGNFHMTRFGGDAFVVVLEDTTKEEVEKYAENILKGLEIPFISEHYTLSIQASIGACIYPNGGSSYEKLIRNAEIALYKAKDLGRNRTVFYEEIMHRNANKKFHIVQDLKNAIEKDQFEIYFQPIFDIQTEETISVETLVRWKHPDFGLLPPSYFVPIAEETGLIIPIGNMLFKKLCEQIAIWQQTYDIKYQFSINLSLKQISYTHMIRDISNILDTYSIKPGTVMFEITETAAMKGANSELELFKEFKRLGILLSIDDFGVGYSSFSLLKKLPFDQIKIDQSFLKECPIHKEDVEIVKTIITLAHNLNLTVVAEGIENYEQLIFLKSTNCDKGQGFLLSQPLIASEFAKRYLKSI